MKRKLWIISLAAVLLIVVGVIYREPLVLRVTGMRPFVEDRFNGWVAMGLNADELDGVLRVIHDPRGKGPNSWVYELSRAAQGHQDAARKLENEGDFRQAVREYKQAHILYYIARFPFISSPEKQAAYEKHIQCYLKMHSYLDPPLQMVRIPFENKEIIGYLRLPAVPKPPVVILTGGVDSWKSDVDFIAESLLAEGLAVFALDMPGTGESAWPLASDSDRVFRKTIEYLQNRPNLDGQRIGVFMISFGGYYAVRLALTEPRIKAAVNVGGPLALSFSEEHAKKVPDVMVNTIAHAMRIPLNSPFSAKLAGVKRLSLDAQGLLKPTPGQAALLSINGDQDELVPIEDLYIISKRGIRQDELVYKGDGHCAAQKNIMDWPSKAAKWLKEKL